MSEEQEKFIKKQEEFIKKQAEKVISAVERIGTIIWTAGFLFTLGIVGLDPNFSTFTFWHKGGNLLLSWFLWPLFLGLHFAK